jgi:nucleotidyltransferase substrate binding protein (TIGR01987 family)
MEKPDIRWIQRFNNFKKALAKLGQVADEKQVAELSELEQEGLIQRFEYTYELAWKTLQDLLKYRGYQEITGPNPVLAQSFLDGLIADGEGWKLMNAARNVSSHTYDSDAAEDIAGNIISSYYELFRDLEKRLDQELYGKQLNLPEN